MTDQEAFNKWYLKDYGVQLWDEFNGDKVVERTWLEACRYKDKKISSLEETIEYVEKSRITLEEKLNKVYKDAKKEMEFRDKKIAYLEAECERVYHPIREFWNIEKDEEMKKLREEVERFRQALYDISQSTYEANPWTVVPSKEALIARATLENKEIK